MSRERLHRKGSHDRSLDLGEQLRQAIELSGLSASEVARRAEIDSAQVLRFLSGERDIRLETAGFICEVLGLQLAESRGRGRPKSAAQKPKTDRRGFSNRAEEAGFEGQE